MKQLVFVLVTLCSSAWAQSPEMVRSPMFVSSSSHKVIVRTDSPTKYYFEVCEIPAGYSATPVQEFIKYLQLPFAPCKRINETEFDRANENDRAAIAARATDLFQIELNQAFDQRISSLNQFAYMSFAGLIGSVFGILGFPLFGHRMGVTLLAVSVVGVVGSMPSLFYLDNMLGREVRRKSEELDKTKSIRVSSQELTSTEQEMIFGAYLRALDQATTEVKLASLMKR